MKRFLVDALIFMLLMFAFMGLSTSNDSSLNNDKLSSFDQNFNSNQEVEDGYVNGEANIESDSNAFADASNYVSNKLVDFVNGGKNFLKNILKSFLD